jgi:WD40 repeat protein
MGLLLAAVLLAQNADGLTTEPRGSVRHPSAVTSIATDPDSSLAAVGLDDGTVLLYKLADRTPVPLGFRSYSGVSGLAFHPGGKVFALATRDGRLAIYDPATWKEMKSGTVPSVITQVAFAADGSSLFATQINGHLIKVSIPALKIERDIFPTDGSLVGALACSPNGKLVATTDRDGHVKTWSTSDLSPVGNWQAHKGFIQALAYDPTGKYLASGGDDHSVQVRALDGTLIREDASHHSEGIRTLSFAPDGRLVSGGQDGLCQFWKAQTFEAGDSLPNYRGFIRASAISRDGKWLVRGGSALDFVPLDRPAAASRAQEYGGVIVAMAAKDEAKRFVTASLDRSLILWSLEAGVSGRTVPLGADRSRCALGGP